MADTDQKDAEKSLLIDNLSSRLDSFRLLRESDPEAADDLLVSMGAQGKVEREMLKELGHPRPLRHVERFPEAHRRAMRALEVYDRNGTRTPSSLSAPGPLKPIAALVVKLLVQVIVRSHQKSSLTHLRQLYALRTANSVVGSPEYRHLTIARRQVDEIIPDLSKSGFPLPAFLVGGAAISGIVSFIQRGLAHDWGRVVMIACFALIGLAAFWCVIQAASVARRRTKVALDASFKALWEVIGDAGDPPRDKSRDFALVATIVLIVVWVLVPLVFALLVARF